MKRVLITGMSGTGKSSVIQELRKLGFEAIDMDEPGWSEYDRDGHQLWNERRLQEALDADDDPILVSGCAENQVKFYPQLTDIILLSAPRDVLVERLQTRTNNPYGKRPEDLDEIFRNLDEVEPRLRRRATAEIDTTASLSQVIDEILKHVGLAR